MVADEVIGRVSERLRVQTEVPAGAAAAADGGHR